MARLLLAACLPDDVAGSPRSASAVDSSRSVPCRSVMRATMVSPRPLPGPPSLQRNRQQSLLPAMATRTWPPGGV